MKFSLGSDSESARVPGFCGTGNGPDRDPASLSALRVGLDFRNRPTSRFLTEFDLSESDALTY